MQPLPSQVVATSSMVRAGGRGLLLFFSVQAQVGVLLAKHGIWAAFLWLAGLEGAGVGILSLSCPDAVFPHPQVSREQIHGGKFTGLGAICPRLLEPLSLSLQLLSFTPGKGQSANH